MLALTDPNEAYRRSEMDARIHGGQASDLVSFCLGQVIAGIGSAVSAHKLGNPTMRSKALTRALTGITALEMGVDRDAPLADSLLHFYGSARRSLLDCVIDFKVERLDEVRADFVDVLQALGSAHRAS